MSAKSGSGPTVTPGLLYHDASAAIEWLCKAFGFRPRLIIPAEDGRIVHAHLVTGNGGVMLSSAEGYAYPHLCRSPRDLGGTGTVEIIVYVEQIEAHFAQAVSAGAEVIIPLEDKPYGGRGYTCRDPEGHVWAFGDYDAWADSQDEN